MGGAFIDPDTGLLYDEEESVAGEEPQVAAENFSPPPEAGISFGKGFSPLDHQGAIELLYRTHRITVDDDDALLMMVTLQTKFAEDLSRMLACHDKAIEAAINSTAGTTVQAVNEALETLKDKTVRAGLTNAMALVERQAVTMEKFQRTNRRHLWVIVTLTSTTWAGLGLALWLLWGLLR